MRVFADNHACAVCVLHEIVHVLQRLRRHACERRTPSFFAEIYLKMTFGMSLENGA